MGFGQKVVVAILLTVVLVPPLAGFYSYFTGIPLHLLASTREEKETLAPSAPPSVSLVSGQAHTLQVPDEVSAALGIRKGQRDSVAVAQAPTMMRPLVLLGSTALDPTRLDRVRARFAPARVVKLAQVWDRSPKTGRTEFRELRTYDHVSKGDLLGVFYSVDVGSKKNDLLDALVQLELDQKILDDAEKHAEAVPTVFLNTYYRAVQGDRNAINRALNNLKLWDIPQDEIDALHAEAKKISADKNAWLKTPEGRWVKGEKQARIGKLDPDKESENPWGRVTLRADFDGVVVERNVHVGEMVVDNTVNLFQIADVSRLLVIANCPEDDLPILESLHGNERRWTVRTVGASSDTGLPGTIDEIGYIIDPNQHTAVIKGYVDNPGLRIRAGQYVSATVSIPPPSDVVEIPTDALVDDGLQSLVFVQPDATAHHFTMRRVQVTQRFERTVFVRSSPMPKEEQLTPEETEEGFLPKEPLRPGERVLLSGAVELKAAVLELESRPEKKPMERVAKAKVRSVSGLESRPEKTSKTGKS
jgi:cobalt-zinc-cadmium efflux system membrane fusion protein